MPGRKQSPVEKLQFCFVIDLLQLIFQTTVKEKHLNKIIIKNVYTYEWFFDFVCIIIYPNEKKNTILRFTQIN